jgi:hypothetical protein
MFVKSAKIQAIYGTLSRERINVSYPILGSIQKYLNRKDVMVESA